MKKILAIFISLFITTSAFADACTSRLSGSGFIKPEVATLICSTLASVATISIIPKTTNAIDLGSSSLNFRALYLGQSLVASYETVAGAGTTVADAAALSATKIVHQITGANGTVGWKMSASMPTNSVQVLLNTTAGVAKIYAESGGTVNGGSADAAFSALTGIKPIICIKTAALTYICS